MFRLSLLELPVSSPRYSCRSGLHTTPQRGLPSPGTRIEAAPSPGHSPCHFISFTWHFPWSKIILLVDAVMVDYRFSRAGATAGHGHCSVPCPWDPADTQHLFVGVTRTHSAPDQPSVPQPSPSPTPQSPHCHCTCPAWSWASLCPSLGVWREVVTEPGNQGTIEDFFKTVCYMPWAHAYSEGIPGPQPNPLLLSLCLKFPRLLVLVS